MKLFSAEIFCSALLLVTNANAFSFDLSKRALKFDASCNTKYGTLTAKQLIDKSIDMQPDLAKAGKDGLDTIIAMLEYQSEVPGAKKPSVSKSELNKIIATYRVLFGDIKTKNDDGTPNPNFIQEAKEHLAAIKVTKDSLNRMTQARKPDLIIHCNDDWLSERSPKGAKPMPTELLKPGLKYLYDMDRKQWIKLKGGKPCQGNKGAATKMNQLAEGTREEGPERITFCKEYLKRQHQLEKDKQPHLWDISRTKLPDTFTTYTQTGKRDQTLPFHISAFGKKIGAKWFHEFMHTELFHPKLKEFSDKRVADSEGGTGGQAYGFSGAVGLAKQKGGKNIAESSRNIENILYWSLAMYYDKWLWSTGNPEDPGSLTTAPAKAAGIDGEFQVEAAAKKGGTKKTTKPADPPKTEAPADQPKTEALPPKTEAPVEPPETEKPVDSPKTSAAAPPPPSSSQAPPPPASTPPAPPVSSPAPPPASIAVPPPSAPQTNLPISTQLPESKPTSAPSISTPTSVASTLLSASVSASLTTFPYSSCSNTLCTMASSSGTPTSSEAIPQETFEFEPLNAGSMTGSEILMIAESVASEQVVAMGLWDQVLAEMGLPSETPSETVEGDPTASLGTGLPSATGGAGGAGNGTWIMPGLRAREESEDGITGRERRMYDFAS